MAIKREKEWYRKFQKGTFLIKGWQSRKREILDALPESDQRAVDDLLERLGEKIGWEWARDSDVRRIDTIMLQQWGDQLRKSRKKGPDILTAEIQKLDAEVDDILA